MGTRTRNRTTEKCKKAEVTRARVSTRPPEKRATEPPRSTGLGVQKSASADPQPAKRGSGRTRNLGTRLSVVADVVFIRKLLAATPPWAGEPRHVRGPFSPPLLLTAQAGCL